MSSPNLFNRKFYLILAFIFLAELFSLFGYILPDFNNFAFLIIIFLALILSLIKLEYGIWIIFAELFIGSKGYLFAFEHGEFLISIRIALWLVVMSVWFGRMLSDWLKKKPKLNFNFFQLNQRNQWFYFIILFLFIAWGIVNGILNHNSFNNIFFDFNGWLYFSLVFPVYSVLASKPPSGFLSHSVALMQIFTASIIWLSVKTFFLLFAFSHNMSSMTNELYRWVRVSGVGEITQMQGGFYRIFFQSHIFVLIGFFIFLLIFTQIQINNNKQNKKFLNSYFLILTSFLSVILISFSRSFWVGLIIGLLFYYFIITVSRYGTSLLFYKIGLKKFIAINATLLLSAALSVGLIAAIVKFPYPNPTGGFNTAELLSERASQVSGEAGVSSRWALLPELWDKIKQSPILGKGFGATITYKSSDPRVLESSPTGEYTTYAFEWGWLDIWLKLGLFGLLAYLALIGKICYDGLLIIKNTNNQEKAIYSGITIGLIVISAVSVFSPYMNHPLGIGYLILCAALMNVIARNLNKV